MKLKMNLKRYIYLLLLLPLLSLTSCFHNSSPKKFDPAQVKFNVSYNPYLDNRIYPSLILGLANYSGDHNKSELNLFSVEVTAPRDGAVLRIVLDSSYLNYVTIHQEIMPTKDIRYTFYPIIKWKYDNLYSTRQQGSVDLTFTCYIDDEEVDIKNLRLNYRSVNECLLSARYSGHTVDFRWLFAGYVNEDHPNIDGILSEILDQGIVNSFKGYQLGTEKSVTQQMQAIWYYALNRGIAYSSISCTSNPAANANVQHIRFFDEVYKNRQANCIDACVFFASIMRKIGLKPIIFVEPCHAYLGYYTDRHRKKIALLETTITGWVDFPALDRSVDTTTGLPSEEKYNTVKRFLTEKQQEKYAEGKMDLTQLKQTVADSLFRRATTYNQEKYEINKVHFIDTSDMSYQQLIIEDLRELVQPIN